MFEYQLLLQKSRPRFVHKSSILDGLLYHVSISKHCNYLWEMVSIMRRKCERPVCTSADDAPLTIKSMTPLTNNQAMSWITNLSRRYSRAFSHSTEEYHRIYARKLQIFVCCSWTASTEHDVGWSTHHNPIKAGLHAVGQTGSIDAHHTTHVHRCVR